MVEKVFWQNPYLTQLEATVSSVDGCVITLDKTIFFAFSGGQESDAGTIGGFVVEQAEKKDTQIFYTLPENHTLNPGDSVDVDIDWARRHALMKLHFGAELTLLLMMNKYPDLEKIGSHIGESRSRIDFMFPESICAQLPWLQNALNDIIHQNLSIDKGFSDEKAQRRYWKIDGFEPVSCGGTHLHTTGEIGALKLKRKNIGKGKERIEISLA
ncbi:alanine--tRNA ligase-related protein [Enterovibrio coralii]|uniref:alanine--tRNA ligase-related protein n=1 Tax=Enterovibrio coralii TaxID=294935 RepID=UPI0012F7A91B|nr:alanyl-tRNA editing protein [Enterovibrio coralii]